MANTLCRLKQTGSTACGQHVKIANLPLFFTVSLYWLVHLPFFIISYFVGGTVSLCPFKISYRSHIKVVPSDLAAFHVVVSKSRDLPSRNLLFNFLFLFFNLLKMKPRLASSLKQTIFGQDIKEAREACLKKLTTLVRNYLSAI